MQEDHLRENLDSWAVVECEVIHEGFFQDTCCFAFGYCASPSHVAGICSFNFGKQEFPYC